jgi:hypothetical protein
MVKFREQVLDNADLLLTDQEANSLGPDLVVKGCRITLQLNAKKLTLVDDIQFIDCDITAKRQLRDFRWHSAFLQGCRFHGRFIGNCFGRRTDPYSPSGGIERCDFSDAILDMCAFYGCDTTSLVFPKWPSFTLLNPGAYAEQMTSLEWPGQLKTWISVFSNFPQANKVASVNYAPTLMKRYKVGEEELAQALSRLPNFRR